MANVKVESSFHAQRRWSSAGVTEDAIRNLRPAGDSQLFVYCGPSVVVLLQVKPLWLRLLSW